VDPTTASRRRRRDRESVPRPSKAFGPVAGSVVALGAWAAVAHNSGAGWVQALGALMAAFLFIGLCAPAFVVRRARCRIVAGPFDATAGTPLELTVIVTTSLRVRPLAPSGETLLTGQRREGQLVVIPAHRGIIGHCEIEVASAAPFGLLWWKKRVVCDLPRPITVAPRLGAADPAVLSRLGSAGPEARPRNARVGEPRGVRAYHSGDLRHWVHWPATAHTGELMVREMETPSREPVVVNAVLPADLVEAERAAERVLGSVTGLLETGTGVVLVTAEPHGMVQREVDNVADAGRRLARALPRPPFGAPVRLRRGADPRQRR